MQYPTIDLFQTGQKIRYLMKKYNYTVQDLQQFLGFSTPQSIYHWFSGRNLPSTDNLYALSSFFHVPVDFLLCGSREDKWFFTAYPSHDRLLLYYDKFSLLCS